MYFFSGTDLLHLYLVAMLILKFDVGRCPPAFAHARQAVASLASQ